MTASQQIVGFLSVLTGAQRGARAPLIDNVDYVVGADEDCDLVLQHDSVAPRHLRLACHATQLRIEALDHDVVLDDRILAPHESIECPLGLLLRLGEVCLGLGAEHQDWSRAICPEPASVDRSGGNAEPHTGRDSADDTQARTAVAAAECSETNPPVKAGVLADSCDALSEERIAPNRLWLRIATILGILLLLIIMLAGWRLSSKFGAAGDPATETVPSRWERTHAVLERLALTDVELTERADGILILTGYCASLDLKNRLTQSLSEAGLRVENRLWPEDRLREVLTQTLERLGADAIEYEYLGRGVVRLHGHLPADLAKEPFLRLLYQDVAGLARIEGDVQTVSDFIADLQRRIREAGLPLERLEFGAEGRTLRVSGRLNAADSPRWNAVVQGFEQAHPGLAPLETAIEWNATRPGREMATGAPVRVSSPRVLGVLIGVDENAFALLDDGAQVTRGDRIDGRYLVEEIRFDRVIAFDGVERKTFHVGVPAHD